MPAPQPGQKWHLPDYYQIEKRFETLVGTVPSGTDAPSLDAASAHIYRLDSGVVDRQSPHEQDEFYFVLTGSRQLIVGEGDNQKTVELGTGDLVFVPAHMRHRFDGEEAIVLLVFFAPNFAG